MTTAPKTAPKTALLVMVHGSPRPVANTDMFRVVEEVRARNVFDHVEVGFMECNTPTIPEAIDTCLAAGAERVVAVPYFLHTGTHVADDLPTLLEEAAAQHPHVQFQMGRYLGTSPLLTGIPRRPRPGGGGEAAPRHPDNLTPPPPPQ